jgi:3-phenylpropionate/cinnamic acid dioxygenase small subunit
MTISVEDRIAIIDILYLYAHLADARQLDRIAEEVFTSDAVCDYGLLLQGRDAIHAFLTGFHGVTATSHCISNVIIQGRGDRARAQCHCIAWHLFDRPVDASRPDGPRAEATMYGGYEDEFIRTQSGWRIARRRALEFRPGQPQIAADGALISESGAIRHPTWP